MTAAHSHPRCPRPTSSTWLDTLTTLTARLYPPQPDPRMTRRSLPAAAVAAKVRASGGALAMRDAVVEEDASVRRSANMTSGASEC